MAVFFYHNLSEKQKLVVELLHEIVELLQKMKKEDKYF
jgi:hypothetical protein